jgi:hypothetical protein
MKPVLSCLVLCAVLNGCTTEPDAHLALTVETDDPAHVVEVERVLLARFESLRPSLLASVDSSITGSTLHFSFRWWVPDWEQLEPVYSTPGRLRASLAGEIRPAFTHDDIRDVVVTYSNSQPALRLRLTAEAGERLTRLTSRNVGAVMAMKLDGETLVEAQVNGVLGTSLEVAGMGIDEAKSLSVILNAGAFPEGVTTRLAVSKAR